MRFRNLEGKPEKKSSKRTISASSEFGSLQMVSEPGTGRYASKEAEPQRGWTRGGVLARTLGLKGGWIGVPHRLEKETSANKDTGPRKGVDCEIPHWLRMRTKHPL